MWNCRLLCTHWNEYELPFLRRKIIVNIQCKYNYSVPVKYSNRSWVSAFPLKSLLHGWLRSNTTYVPMATRKWPLTKHWWGTVICNFHTRTFQLRVPLPATIYPLERIYTTSYIWNRPPMWEHCVNPYKMVL